MNSFVFQPAINPFVPPTSGGVSKDADLIREKKREIRDRTDKAVSGEGLENARRAIDDVFLEALHPNWDGYGAAPVTRETAELAHDFLDLLPNSLPAPEIAADPDGDISFEWRAGSRRVFSVSISESGKLTYAGLRGASSVHGTEFFSGGFPGTVMFHLAGLVRHW
jgi:hypothetical protein